MSCATHLKGVTDQCGEPSLGQTTGTLLGNGDLDTIEYVLVLGRVDLQTALHQIQRHNKGVGGTAAQNATNTAQSEVFVASKLAGVSRRGGSSCNLTTNHGCGIFECWSRGG